MTLDLWKMPWEVHDNDEGEINFTQDWYTFIRDRDDLKRQRDETMMQ